MRPEPSPRPIVVRPLPGPLTPDFVHALRDRKVRDRERLFLAEGLRFLTTALDSGTPFAGLVVCRPRLTGSLAHTLVGRLRRAHVPLLDLPPGDLDDLTVSPDAQGVLAVHPQLWDPLPPLVRRNDLWIGLESVRTAGNLGTLLRSGEAAGATGILLFGPPRERPDPFDPGAVRASMGSVFAHRYVATNHREFRRWNRRYDLTVLGAAPNAPTDYRSVTYRRPVVLMLGDEREGLSEGQIATCDALVRIPMCGRPDSLNLAMAGTLLLYEAHNQRHPVKR